MRNTQTTGFKDVFGMEFYEGDSAVMWSDNQGRLVHVKVLEYRPITRKVKVERQEKVGTYEMKTFWTNAFSNKFYLLLDHA